MEGDYSILHPGSVVADRVDVDFRRGAIGMSVFVGIVK